MNIKFGGNSLGVSSFVKHVVRGDLELRHGETLYEVKMFHQFNLIGRVEDFFMYVFENPDEFTVNNQAIAVEN